MAGISRSPTVILAYLIANEKMDLESAFGYVRGKSLAFPNFGFMKQLKEYEDKLKKSNLTKGK